MNPTTMGWIRVGILAALLTLAAFGFVAYLDARDNRQEDHDDA
jgi:hypothetical protein